MDYFSELLESYTKLKKRTFKLTYINEADEKKGDDLSKYIKPVEAAYKKAITGLGNGDQVGVGEGKNINFEYVAPEPIKRPDGTESPGLGQGSVKVSGSNIGEKIYTQDEWSSLNWKHSQGRGRKILAAWGAGKSESGSDEAVDDAATARAQEAAQAEADAIAQAELEKQERRTIGGFLKQSGKEEAATKQQLEKVKSNIDDFCQQHSGGATAEIERLCSKSWAYVAAGESRMGLEYKLATAKATTVVDPDTGITKQEDASAALINQAARSAAFLTSFLSKADERKCKFVKDRIGMFKGKELVLFGDNPNEGIVVGEPNAVQKLALKQVQTTCPGITTSSLTQLVGDGINDKEKNAIKGTFFEAVLVFAGNAAAARGISDPVEREAALRLAMKDLLTVLRDKKPTLEAILGGMDPEAGQSIDDAFAKDVQAEALALLGNPTALTNWVMNEIRAVDPFMKFMGADSVVHGGKTSKTGQRADLMFAYKDPKVAKEKAKAIGSSVTDLGDGTFGVGVGLKRLNKMSTAKFGEINSRERMLNLITGALSADRNIEPGFQRSIQERLFGRAPKERTGKIKKDKYASYKPTQREKDLSAYATNLETSLEESTLLMVEDKTFINAEGKIKSQHAAATLGLLADQLPEKIDLTASKPGPLATAFFNFDGDEPTKKDFSGNSKLAIENRARAREQVMRVARFRQLQKDLEDPDKREAAMDYMLKSALICGSNKHNMNQLIVDNDGNMLAVKHNEAFDLICKARNNPDPDQQPQFTFKDSSVMITVGDISIKFSQEGTEASDNQRETRSLVKLGRNTLEKTSVAQKVFGEQQENSSTLMKYLEGQMRLLETLVNQAK